MEDCDYAAWNRFVNKNRQNIKSDCYFLNRLIFSNESVVHMNEDLNKRRAGIWGMERSNEYRKSYEIVRRFVFGRQHQ